MILNYLKDTDGGAAKAKSYWSGLEDQKKTILADQKLKANGTSATERAVQAEASQEYKKHIKLVEEAHYDWLVVMNQRKSAELQIEMWRSFNANQRKGNI